MFPRGRSSVYGGEEAQSFAMCTREALCSMNMINEALCSITSSVYDYKLCVPEGDNSVR